ncbi:MAG TPA: carboxylating nicotinate-nucleotide diphosphorylase [Bacillota bacterium]|nr:carboxylating nicotinate-nucleotide diphosphorylase [Bacillota bacterium]
MDEIIKIIKEALHEDMPKGDVSTEALFGEEVTKARLIAKESGVISGLDVAKAVFHTVDLKTEFEAILKNGDMVSKGDVIATVSGKTKSLLKAERTALNFLQRMSGIATLTASFVQKTAGTKTKIYDTRKTTPNLRILEKKAVVDGGGVNHRMNLSDMVMLKDNHIKAAGSITEAVETIRKRYGKMFQVEVEVENCAMFEEALMSKCDIIMLDNMSNEEMAKCVNRNSGKKILEASGNMTLDRIASVASLGVDRISVGMLTHSAKALDISMKF